MVKLVLALSLFLSSGASPWLNNLDSAKVIAQKDQKLILLNFSGSDWCIPCISLRHDIFETMAFQQYADRNLVLVNADFPRKKSNKLTPEQTKLNEVLAEKYNKEGVFPLTLLLNKDGVVIRTWEGYYKKGADGLIAEIGNYIH